jgi:hypothetical protein
MHIATLLEAAVFFSKFWMQEGAASRPLSPIFNIQAAARTAQPLRTLKNASFM